MQRLFSTFAEGWPGAGLLLQRLLTGTIVVYCVVLHVIESNKFGTSLPCLIAAIAGVLLVVGLWTPLAGITIAASALWAFFFEGSAYSLTAIIAAVLGVTVAMIGPGMWSIDARLYGRKHLKDPRD